MNRKFVKRHDPLTPLQRSAQMAKIRAKRNRSTEMRVAGHLIQCGFRGWKRHAADVPGHPDFYFEAERIAIFVDGCFWHGCPRCRRNVPHSRRQFWQEKIESNRRRDSKVKRILRSQGHVVIRIWEHALCNDRWLARLRSALRKVSGSLF
jgi:DNA mismatch endonuclease, patch repair protein